MPNDVAWMSVEPWTPAWYAMPARDLNQLFTEPEPSVRTPFVQWWQWMSPGL